jgi:hypothetical protein
MSDLDLDIDFDAPDAVAEVLRMTADRYRQAIYECEENEATVPVWRRFARILERAARACDRIVKRWEGA